MTLDVPVSVSVLDKFAMANKVSERTCYDTPLSFVPSATDSLEMHNLQHGVTSNVALLHYAESNPNANKGHGSNVEVSQEQTFASEPSDDKLN